MDDIIQGRPIIANAARDDGPPAALMAATVLNFAAVSRSREPRTCPSSEGGLVTNGIAPSEAAGMISPTFDWGTIASPGLRSMR